MPSKTREASLLVPSYSFIDGPNGEHSSDRIHCTYDGHTQLHPLCYERNDSDLVDRCIKYFTGQHEEPHWRKDVQKGALERWSQCHQALDTTLWKDGLDLQFFVQLFNDYFFCAPAKALKHLIQVQWTEFDPTSPSCQTSPIPSSSPADKPPRGALIRIQRADPCQPITGETAQRILGALLHGMAHALLVCYGCGCNDCRCPVTRSRTVGMTGHGPVWVRLCEAMEAEAERVLHGLPGRWDLDCRERDERERRARKQFEKNPLARLELQRRGERLSG